jgi:hypothetical protein
MQCGPCNKSSLLLKEKDFFFSNGLKLQNIISFPCETEMWKTIKSQKTIPFNSKLILI